MKLLAMLPRLVSLQKGQEIRGICWSFLFCELSVLSQPARLLKYGFLLRQESPEMLREPRFKSNYSASVSVSSCCKAIAARLKPCRLNCADTSKACLAASRSPTFKYK